jgi:hypothetical protein
MIYGRLVSKFNVNYGIVLRIRIEEPIKIMPGQYMAIIIPNKAQLFTYIYNFSDYENVIELYIQGQRRAIIESIPINKRILLDGPLGLPIKISGNKVLALACEKEIYKIQYIINYMKNIGLNMDIVCLDIEDKVKDPEVLKQIVSHDIIIAVFPKRVIKELKKLFTYANISSITKIYVLIDWVGFNCMRGVCDVCAFNGVLPCFEGPFIDINKIKLDDSVGER